MMASPAVRSICRYSNYFKVAATILIVLGLSQNLYGIRLCYRCDTVSNGRQCVDSPSNVTDGEISCNGSCTIRRKDYAYMREDASLISLHRTCERNPPVLDAVEVHGYFRMYYRSCKNYLCNSGSGIQSLRDIPIDPAWHSYPDVEVEANKGLRSTPLSYSLLLSVAYLLLIFC